MLLQNQPPNPSKFKKFQSVLPSLLNVLDNVNSVKPKVTTVPSVDQTESMPQPVNVNLTTSITKSTVKNVPTNVKNVSTTVKPTIQTQVLTVLNVPPTESTFHSVTVQKDTSMKVLLIVNHAHLNVLPVPP